MARLHNYRYEYKKSHFHDKPQYSTDITLRIYVRYSETPAHEIIPFMKVYERYQSDESSYMIGDVKLSDLVACREYLRSKDLFLANIPQFFIDRD